MTYSEPSIVINKDIAADFSTGEAANFSDMEKAYGLKLTAAQKDFLSKNKFLMMNMMDTSIRPNPTGDSSREFADLYNIVRGNKDYKERTQANAVYLSSDVFFNAYNNLYTELLKEMENKIFFPSMKTLSADFYQSASTSLAAAKTPEEKLTWTEVRNYFAVPYAIFTSGTTPLTTADYTNASGQMLDPDTVQSGFKTKDAKVDTLEAVTAFVKTLHLENASEKSVLADLQKIYSADGKGVPDIFKKEFDDYAQQENVAFSVDFSQFTPRGSYTSSSLRREYFRGMNWFTQIPFFVKSPQLTKNALVISSLMQTHPLDQKKYDQLEATINFLVGRSDDLMPKDYADAAASAKGAADQTVAINEYLKNAHDPEIKSLAAFYNAVGTEQSADVLLKTKGMRFFSGKFILDGSWTGLLTQGDEAIKPGYTQKLPPMASSLEVMALLGSDYAKSKIPTLDFYKPETSKAIDQAMSELTTKVAALEPAFWQSNIYNGWLWTIQGLFGFEKAHKKELPAYMQSPLWDAKTLMTGAAFWTELRHATILYAKQSFAELGGGPGPCDARKIPPAPKSYIEPQLLAYTRLQYIAERTNAGLKAQGYDLQNMAQLDAFTALMKSVVAYTQKELSNATLQEKISSHQETDDAGTTCTVYTIDDGSDWEALRIGIVNGLKAALPAPTEGPILLAKDRRAAIIADVHTGGDSGHPAKILYEATGVPNVIIVAIKDINGPRYTIGFTYSQYEMTKLYGGQRMTDEDWQKNFYVGDDTNAAYDYTPKNTWPAVNAWFAPIVDLK